MMCVICASSPDALMTHISSCGKNRKLPLKRAKTQSRLGLYGNDGFLKRAFFMHGILGAMQVILRHVMQQVLQCTSCHLLPEGEAGSVTMQHGIKGAMTVTHGGTTAMVQCLSLGQKGCMVSGHGTWLSGTHGCAGTR